MTKRMLIDATHEEETRVAITDGNKLVEYDYESQSRKPLKGSIFLAKVTRVEPSLQAAFVNFGGNRHGFLPFSEIHPDYFRIPISDREALMAEQEQMMREQDEADAFEDEITAGQEDGEFQDNEEEQEDEYVEEIGGSVGSLADDEEVPVAKENIAEVRQEGFYSESDQADVLAEAEDRTAPDGESEESESSSFDDDADDNTGDQDTAEGEENAEGSDDRKEGRRGGRRNFRGRRGRRSPSRNRSPEMVGGEESDDDQRFRFNLRRKYKIQEVIKRGQIMLVQVNKEERGNKGAAVGAYLSLPGRYCVLMPNSPRGGGVSRKIANYKDRARMRELVRELEVPKGMSVIVRTAGVTRTKQEIKRDLDYLMRLWDSIRDLTLKSTAPALVYEEADLIKRAVRDLYARDVEEILVAGDEGFATARNFMKMMIPSHVAKVKQYEAAQLPLFHRYQIEGQISEIGQPSVRLKSGGYLVINPTEALVSIDVNSGKSTKGRHIEETALKTNLEAAEEVARQLRLRDLGGLVVIDFIDMEDRRNNAKVERKMKEALSQDRARVQVGRISSFGLMELSRQRLSPSLTEAQFETCKTCSGIGLVRTREGMSIIVLRAIEEEGIRARASEVIVHVSNDVALYILNYKRKNLLDIESRYGLTILLRVDDAIAASDYRVEVSKALEDNDGVAPVSSDAKFYAPTLVEDDQDESEEGSTTEQESDDEGENAEDQQEPRRDESGGARRRGRRGGRRRRGNGENGEFQSGRDGNRGRDYPTDAQGNETTESTDGNEVSSNSSDEGFQDNHAEEGQDRSPKKGRRGRGGRGRDRQFSGNDQAELSEGSQEAASPMTDEAKPQEAVVAEGLIPAKKTTRKKPSNDDAVKAESSEAAQTGKQEKSAPPVPAVARSYEVVNQEPKEKKRGWWNRLVD